MKYAFCFFAAILFVACKPEVNPLAQQLPGEWKGIEWLVANQPSGRDATTVRFSFEAQDHYTATYGDQLEKGNYKVKGDKLYTTAEDRIEKMVKILSLENDTLVLGMNRVGQAEKLILIRVK